MNEYQIKMSYDQAGKLIVVAQVVSQESDPDLGCMAGAIMRFLQENIQGTEEDESADE